MVRIINEEENVQFANVRTKKRNKKKSQSPDEINARFCDWLYEYPRESVFEWSGRQRRGRDDNYSVNRSDHAGGRRSRSSTRLSIEQQPDTVKNRMPLIIYRGRVGGLVNIPFRRLVENQTRYRRFTSDPLDAIDTHVSDRFRWGWSKRLLQFGRYWKEKVQQVDRYADWCLINRRVEECMGIRECIRTLWDISCEYVMNAC